MWKSPDGRWHSVALEDPRSVLNEDLARTIEALPIRARQRLRNSLGSRISDYLDWQDELTLPDATVYVDAELPEDVKLGADSIEIEDLLEGLYRADPRWSGDLFFGLLQYLNDLA